MMIANTRLGRWAAPTAIVSVVVGMLGSALLVWSASHSAFSGTTTNPDNSWQAGTVTITDNDSAGAMFVTETGMTPSYSQERCIKVTYTGNVSAPVRLYAGTLGGTGLAAYLNLKVEMAPAAFDVAFGSACTGFTASTPSTIYNTGLMSTFATTYDAYADNLATWTPDGSGADDFRVFRFTVTGVDNNDAQTLNSTLPFIWEAQAA